MPAWAYYPYRAFWFIIDGLFPPRCVGCGQRGERWCSRCQAQVQRVPMPQCTRCGYPLEAEGPSCPACTRGPARWGFEQARAWALYQGMMARVVRALKYRRRLALGETLARVLAPWAQALPWPQGCLVPVPLSPSRRRERGYNQVALVARPLAWLLNLPYCPQALQRDDGPSQVGMDWASRWHNVRYVFRAARRWVQNRVIWLADDVMTTGATLHAAALALKAAGATAVYALTWARVPRYATASPTTRLRLPSHPPTSGLSSL